MKFFFALFLVTFTSPLLADNLQKSLHEIEKRISGSIGVSIFNTADNSSWNYKGNHQFPMMSTFKTLACAKMLFDSKKLNLDKNKRILIEKDDIVFWSPITEKLVGKFITLEEACEATMLMSDNTAANIILKEIGGPQELTKFLRSIEDEKTRLDRIEPELNQATLNDPRDTTTPNAIVKTLRNLLLGKVLDNDSQNQLKTWMQDNKIADSLLRSVLPEGWQIADRTGGGGNGSRAITAMLWKERRAPIFIAIYLTQTDLSMAERNIVIVEIGESVFEARGIN